MVDHVAEDDASLIGSITGCLRAIDTLSWIPPTTLPLNSEMALSAMSALSKVMNPQFFST